MHIITSREKQPGFTPINTLINLFLNITKSQAMFQDLFSEEHPMKDFPYQTLFFRNQFGDSYTFLEEKFKILDRLGGTLSHLETELKEPISAL